MDTLILQIKYGGLGDHLFYSHIPRIAKELGYKEVLISNKSDFRNAEYKHLIWELNPFVDGFTDKEGVHVADARPTNTDENLLDRIMLNLGLDDGKRFHEPELHYKPILVPEVIGKTVYDPNYLSNAGLVNAHKVDTYFSSHDLSIDLQFTLRNNSIPTTHFSGFIQARSLYDFIDILASAKDIYCLVTGTASLASALGKKAHVFYTAEMPAEFRHSRNNTYIKL